MQRITIADDHALIREGIKVLLRENQKFEIVGEAADGSTAIELLKTTPTDIILLDIDMPGKNGVEVGQWIKSMQLNIKIVYITSHAHFFTFYQAWKLNPQGFLFKENALEELIACLKHLQNNQTYYSSESKLYIEQHTEAIGNYEAVHEKMQTLSPKEKQVLYFITQNLTTNEIASKVFNSYKTIENHRYNICRKLDINGSNNLMRFAIQNMEIIENLTRKEIEHLN